MDFSPLPRIPGYVVAFFFVMALIGLMKTGFWLYHLFT